MKYAVYSDAIAMFLCVSMSPSQTKFGVDSSSLPNYILILYPFPFQQDTHKHTYRPSRYFIYRMLCYFDCFSFVLIGFGILACMCVVLLDITVDDLLFVLCIYYVQMKRSNDLHNITSVCA